MTSSSDHSQRGVHKKENLSEKEKYTTELKQDHIPSLEKTRQTHQNRSENSKKNQILKLSSEKELKVNLDKILEIRVKLLLSRINEESKIIQEKTMAVLFGNSILFKKEKLLPSKKKSPKSSDLKTK